MGYLLFITIISFLFFSLILIKETKEKEMDFTKLTAALNNLATAIQGLPAAIAAENTKSQATIDAATAQVDSLTAAVTAAAVTAA